MEKFIYEMDLIGALNKAFLSWSNMPEWREKKIIEEIENFLSTQLEPSQVARDIATIIENEQDMRVILKNAEDTVCHCNVKENAELIAEILDCDVDGKAYRLRDIPMKPIETTDRAWGIPSKQAVCPKCDYYLGDIAFLGDYKGKRVTYCETCGQAIDWEGWEFDDERFNQPKDGD